MAGITGKIKMEQQVQTIHDNAGRAGAEASHFQVRRQGVNATLKEAQSFVKRQAIGQVVQAKI